MSALKTLTFCSEDLSFSAGHFTIFSATDRERLHGHNYHIRMQVSAPINEPGLTFDYRLLNKKVQILCDSLNTRFLLPDRSPYLNIVEHDDTVIATFNQKPLSFLKEDILLLPLDNITLETLSDWFLETILEDKVFIETHGIAMLSIEVCNGPSQGATAVWNQ